MITWDNVTKYITCQEWKYFGETERILRLNAFEKFILKYEDNF